MIILPSINPVAFQLGVFQIHWYGICYAISFVLGYFYLCWQARNKSYSNNWNPDQIIDLLCYMAVGVIFGSRIGYVMIYQPQWLLTEPWQVLYFWAPGRSFHAGVIAVMICVWIFCWVNKRKFWEVADFLVPIVPIGIFFGRIGNFINGELWGRIASPDLSWAVLVPYLGNQPRHPSQLYEALLEGVGLFILLLVVKNYTRRTGVVAASFFIGYGILRFIAEFFREPDIDHGYIWGQWLTMGQVLCLPMIIFGLGLLIWARSPSAHANA